MNGYQYYTTIKNTDKYKVLVKTSFLKEHYMAHISDHKRNINEYNTFLSVYIGTVKTNINI